MSYAGWCWPHSQFCMVSDRPTFLHRDDGGELHCEDGPAIGWSDGFCIYRIHGVTVPAWIVMNPEKITLAAIDKEGRDGSAEVRRIMIDRMGTERYLQESGAKVIAIDMIRVCEGSEEYMPRALWQDKDGRRFLEGCDGSTNRTYFMQTSGDAKTCAEAHSVINGGLDDAKCVLQS